MAADPFEELRRIVNEVGNTGLSKLVAHRGFHSQNDRLSRPLENTLPAYEYAWTAGVELCECDVALTSDGELIVFHDATTERLSLHKSDSYEDVTRLPWSELKNIPLKNGCRIPLLKELLETAVRMGPSARVVIEMKPDKRTSLVASALCLLLQQNRHFIPHISLIFSFHNRLIHAVNGAFRQAFPHLTGENRPKMMLLAKSIKGAIPTIPNGHVKPKLGGAVADNEFVLDFSLDVEELKEMTRGLLAKDGVKLDGIYFLYHNSLEEMSGIAVDYIQQLSKEMNCGVWLSKESPDNVSLFRMLCDLGARFVNTDLPPDFVSW